MRQWQNLEHAKMNSCFITCDVSRTGPAWAGAVQRFLTEVERYFFGQASYSNTPTQTFYSGHLVSKAAKCKGCILLALMLLWSHQAELVPSHMF